MENVKIVVAGILAVILVSALSAYYFLGPSGGPAPGKLKFFYVIHVHDGLDETKPFLENEFSYVKDAVESIASVLEAHGAKGTFLFVRRAAEAAWNYQGEANLLKELEERGHDVGMHSHLTSISPGESPESYVMSVRENILRCGVTNLRVYEGRIAGNGTTTDLELAADAGFTVYSGNSAEELKIRNITVEGNTPEMASATGNLMHPWRPNYLARELLTHNPQGKLVAVDHIGPGVIHEEGEQTTTLEQSDFDRLKERFNATFDFIDPNLVNAWGFVTHNFEYTTHRYGFGPVAQSALDLLDNFLSYVDGFVSQGRVEYTTSSEVADAYIASGF